MLGSCLDQENQIWCDLGWEEEPVALDGWWQRDVVTQLLHTALGWPQTLEQQLSGEFPSLRTVPGRKFPSFHPLRTFTQTMGDLHHLSCKA